KPIDSLDCLLFNFNSSNWDHIGDSTTLSSPTVSICPSPKPPYLVSGSLDGTVRLWDLNSNCKTAIKVFDHKSSVHPVEVLQGSTPRLFSGSESGTICEWDISGNLNNSKPIHTFSGHEYVVHALKLIPGNPPLLFSGSWDNTIKQWNISDGNTNTTAIRTFSDHKDQVEALAVVQGQNNVNLLFSSSEDTISSEFDYNSTMSHAVRNTSTGYLLSLATFNDKTRLFTGSYEGNLTEWDLSTPNVTMIRTFNTTSPVYGIAVLNENPPRLFTGNENGLVKEWDMTDSSKFTLLRTFNHGSAINGLLVMAGLPPRLFSAADNVVIKEWDISQGSTNVEAIL
ncbi:hypothetical protein HK096_000487, partial [Nowakowskiella sp. JEL0078]